MPTLDNTFLNLAKNLISDKGKKVTLTRETKVYSTATGKSTITPVDHATKVSPPAPFNQSRINDTTIIAGDMECIIAAKGLSIVPQAQSDKVTFDGTVWQIVTVEPIFSGEVAAAYTLQLRQ